MISHLPRPLPFCRKDRLLRYMRRMAKHYPKLYNFCPRSYHLPAEYARIFVEEREYCDCSKSTCWIVKPVGKSQGRGIAIFQEATKIRYDEPSVVQEYILEPLLVNGHKVDLRLYLAIVSCRPLVFYAYHEGLVRFACHKYSLKEVSNPYAHLTNVAINRTSLHYLTSKDGWKWSFQQLREYLIEEKIQDTSLWNQVLAILLLTVVGSSEFIGHLDDHHHLNVDKHWDGSKATSCFQLLGFDVLVDEQLKPYLLEVNSQPGLSIGTLSSGNDRQTVDWRLKPQMLHELFDLLGLPNTRQGNHTQHDTKVALRKWTDHCPAQVGGWLRLFPFSERTKQSAASPSLKNTRTSIRQIRRYLQLLEEHLQATNTIKEKDKEAGNRKQQSFTLLPDQQHWVPPV